MDIYFQMQKFESTRNIIGFQYSRLLKELYVLDALVFKFQTSVVTLKIQNWFEEVTIDSAMSCYFGEKLDESMQIILV